MSNQSIIKAHTAAVRKQILKVVALHNDYGLTVPQLAKRFEVSQNFIKVILRKVRSNG